MDNKNFIKRLIEYSQRPNFCGYKICDQYNIINIDKIDRIDIYSDFIALIHLTTDSILLKTPDKIYQKKILDPIIDRKKARSIVY